MKGTVSASDLVPEVYQDGSSDEEFDTEDHVDDLTYDVFNLVACDNHPLNIDESSGNLEEAILSSTARATQLLVNR